MQNKINGQRRFNWILTCSSLAHNFNYIKHYIKLYSNNLFGRIPIRKTFLLCSRGLYFFCHQLCLCLSYPFYVRMAKNHCRVHKCTETVFNHLAPYPEWIKTRKCSQGSHFSTDKTYPFTCWYFVVLNETNLPWLHSTKVETIKFVGALKLKLCQRCYR